MKENRCFGKGFSGKGFGERKVWNKDEIDYYINIPNNVCNDVPIYKNIGEYKNKPQLDNYNYHIALANSLKEYIEFYNRMIDKEVDDDFLVEYLDYKYNNYKYLGDSKYPDWYYYKNDNIKKAIDSLKGQLEYKIMDKYDYKTIDLYTCDRVFHQKNYLFPDEINNAISDCAGAYVLVDGEKNRYFNYKDNREIYLKAMKQKNVGFTPSFKDEENVKAISRELIRLANEIEEEFKFYTDEYKTKVNELIKYLKQF